MHLRHRHRRSMYGYEREPRFPKIFRTLLTLGAVLLLGYWLLSFVLRIFGLGNTMERTAATLYTEGRGIINVSLQGEEAQPAENGMNMFPDDTVTTGQNTRVALEFFDGTWARADVQSIVSIDESMHGRNESSLLFSLDQGKLWVSTPDMSAFTGAITRTVQTKTLSFALPPDTEAVLTDNSLMVYSANGAGVTVTMSGHPPIAIGEGQKWALSQGEAMADDLYAYRESLTATDLQDAFLMSSRQLIQRVAPVRASTSSTLDVLVVSEPAQGFTSPSPTVTVRGSVNANVQKVTINGHAAPLDRSTRTFTQEVSPPEGQEALEIVVKALDADDATLATVTRRGTVQRPVVPVDAPTVTSPASTGETFRTDAQEIVLRGTSPETAAAIEVNNYRLQLFNPEKGTWSYLASQPLGNLKPGSNVYSVVSIDGNGNRSNPASITIIVGEGAGDGGSGATSTPPRLDPSTLPTNAPLAAGTLSVTAPTAGTTHAETGTGFLIEGTTSPQTASVWINDYQLQLFRPGKTYWNYIASTDFANLKPGQNVYRIVARNDQREILDVLEYTVTYTPSR